MISIKVQRKRRPKRRTARLFNFGNRAKIPHIPAKLRQKFVPLTRLARLPGPHVYEKWLKRITESLREEKTEVVFSVCVGGFAFPEVIFTAFLTVFNRLRV